MHSIVVPAQLWSSWNWEPAILLGLVCGAAVYARGLHTVWTKAGVGRGARRLQTLAFAGGLLAIFIALVSPLDALSESLFSAHMVQHMLLMLVAAPLFVLSSPLNIFRFALPPASRRLVGEWWNRATVLQQVSDFLIQPLLAWFLNAILLWTWHLPGLYQAALGSNLVHGIEHLFFFGGALLFWWTLFRPGEDQRLAFGASMLYIFTAALSSTGLGVLMTFTAQPWYPLYEATAPAWGLAPLDDQQLAGLLMWIPGGAIYVITASTLFVLWLDAVEREVRQKDLVKMNQISEPRPEIWLERSCD